MKPDIYSIRKLGENHCKTKGSEHYKSGEIEPIEYIISQGLIEDFCVANIIKYISRFKKTRNINDLVKVADYAHILAGIEVTKINEKEAQKDAETKICGFIPSKDTRE